MAIVLALNVGAAARSPSCEHPERLVLANGIEVLLAPEPATSTLAVVSSVHVGTRHDPPGYEGLAHFVEHLTLRKAPGFASALGLYQAAGAFRVDARTRRDATDYYAILPAAQLERALWIEARRLGLGLDALDEAGASQERQVLQQEWSADYARSLGHALAQAIDESVFAPPHPYRGARESEASLARLTLAEARAFFARHYQPERVRLILLGGFDVAQAKVLLERHLGSLPAGARAEGQTLAERECAAARLPLTAPSARRLVLSAPLGREFVELHWPLAAGENGERWRGVMAMFERALSDAGQQAGVSHEVRVGLEQQELGSFWKLCMGLVPGKKLELAEPLIRMVLKDLRRNAPDASSLLARQQAFELSEQLLETGLLGRALGLAKRECSSSPCVTTSQQVAPALFEELDRFSLERALLVERRYRVGRRTEGSIERSR
jgi:zinc protease